MSESFKSKEWLMRNERALIAVVRGTRPAVAAAIGQTPLSELQGWLNHFNGGKKTLTEARIAEVKRELGGVTVLRTGPGPMPAKHSARNGVAADLKIAGPNGDMSAWLEKQGLKPKADVVSYQVEVTPPLAARWLTLNHGNRTPSNAKIRRFAAAIKAGRWAVNGETIKFSATGRLLDGQSRLRAIVAAGVPAVLEVRGGLPDLAQQSMDIGESRKGSQTLEMLGEKYPAVLAPALKLVWQYERGVLGSVKYGGNAVLENMELAPFLAKHAGLKASVGWVTTEGEKLTNLLPASTAAGMHYLFGRVEAAACQRFFTGLATGAGLTVTSPIYLLREQLLETRANKMKFIYGKQQILAHLVLAWNKYLTGDKSGKLQWAKGEPFPKIADKGGRKS